MILCCFKASMRSFEMRRLSCDPSHRAAMLVLLALMQSSNSANSFWAQGSCLRVNTSKGKLFRYLRVTLTEQSHKIPFRHCPHRPLVLCVCRSSAEFSLRSPDHGGGWPFLQTFHQAKPVTQGTHWLRGNLLTICME